MYVYTLLKKVCIYTLPFKNVSVYTSIQKVYIYTLIQKVCTETVQRIYYFICSTKHMYDSCHAPLLCRRVVGPTGAKLSFHMTVNGSRMENLTECRIRNER